MLTRWRQSRWIVGTPVAALLVAVSICGARGLLIRGQPAWEPSDKRLPYTVVIPPGWEAFDLASTSRPYEPYFRPEALDRQATQIGSELDVDALHPATIRTPEGSLGTLFLDDKGRVVLAARFPVVRPFSEGLAVVATTVDVARGNRVKDFGFIDRTGRIAIKPVFENADRFREGRAAVQKGGRWGFIDRLGREVIPAHYTRVEEFRDGVARAWPNHDTVTFIDRDGRSLFQTESASVGEFSEGLVFAVHPSRPGIGPGSKWGYMDRDFRFAFQLDDKRFGRCLEFHEGRAAVELSRSSPPRWGFFSREGELAIPGPFALVQPFSEDRAAVRTANELLPRWGYIDKDGKMVVTPRYFEATAFSEGLAAVLVPVDDKGGPEPEPEPDANRPPAPGTPGRSNRGRWGYIDREGRLVIPPTFYRAEPFVHGLARVQETPYVDGYIDRTGAFVWKLTEPPSGPNP